MSFTLHTHNDIQQGTDEWHDLRRGIVTASTVNNLITTRTQASLDYTCPKCAAPPRNPCAGTRTPTIKTPHPERTAHAAAQRNTLILDVANNDTSQALTNTLVAERITNHTEEIFINDDMMRGIEDEPRARNKYAEHYGTEVTETGFMTLTGTNFKLGYSPDGLVYEDGLIEIKSRKPKKHLSTILSGHPPRENMAQLQCGLLVTGRQWIDYVSFCAGMPLWVKRVYPEPDWFDAITAAVYAYEENAATKISTYTTAIAGFPTTDRELTEIRF